MVMVVVVIRLAHSKRQTLIKLDRRSGRVKQLIVRVCRCAWADRMGGW